ncbi:uncharacterized protein LOC124433868 isoform X4 [Xenia sp. Carnegie-2017]|uniref:uncharacterized protein LOC124433868 isoform X2 n=1 Tax=Xenia sp. Carnegie-2017 TaxID=2897299 RepID=UPI001F0370FA|nr:uncharacterized protein LOC124433868 isoform X2 [Xenia sp. Carnegie-2017]XP_046839655.1 uncharacterized protein LOC124433868 isoform X4 [Xenia sp. Carnegie-2017]
MKCVLSGKDWVFVCVHDLSRNVSSCDFCCPHNCFTFLSKYICNILSWQLSIKRGQKLSSIIIHHPAVGTRRKQEKVNMKITYLVIALGLLCTFAYAQAKHEDGVMKEYDEETAPVETVKEEFVENDDENPEEESDDETDPEHDLEQSDDRELTENNNDVKADPSVEKRSPRWSYKYYRRPHITLRHRRRSWTRRRRWA